MATNFPTGLDTLVNPNPTDITNSPSHSGQHTDENDAIEAMETKIGVDGSAVPATLDYKINNPASANPGHTHTLTSGATDVTASAAEVNQLDGVAVGGNASGDILTTDGIETVTNKTITGAGNTISGLVHGTQVDNPTGGVHGVTGTVVGTTDGQILTNKTIDGSLNTISNVDLASDVTGNLPVTNLASGTGATGTTFWRGDGAWGTPPGASSPLTTKGDIYTHSTIDTALPVGTDGQFLKANSGTSTGLEWGIGGGGGGGGGLQYYLHQEASSIGGAYRELQPSPADDTENIDTANCDSGTGQVLIRPFATVVSDPGTTIWPSGDWTFDTWAAVDSNTGVSTISIHVFKRTQPGGTETELFNITTGELAGTSPALYAVETVQPEFSVNASDRLVIKYFAQSTSGGTRTVSLYYEGTANYTHVHTPFANTIISPLNTKGDLYGFDTADARVPVGTDGQVLTADSGDAQGVTWQTPVGSSSFITNETPTGTINGVNTAFDTSTTYVAGTIQVYLDGVLQKSGASFDFVETDSNTITFNTAPVTGTVLLVTYQHLVSTSGNADTVDGYNANATPTANNIAVLDSNALLPEVIGTYRKDMSRQAFINGNFDVWQRGTSSTLADLVTLRLADKWQEIVVDDGGTLPTLTRSQQLLTPGDLDKSYFYSRLNTNGAGSAFGVDAGHFFSQRIEHGVRYLCGAGKTVTLSFWARSSIATKKIGMFLQEVYGSGGSPTSVETVNGTNFTLTSTWTKYTHTFTTNTQVGKTFGTDNNDYVEVVFMPMWGTNDAVFVGAGSPETYIGSGNIDLAQLQLCAGSVSLSFEPKSFGDELLACQRYYQKSYAYNTPPSTATAVGAVYFDVGTATVNPLYANIYLIVPMRITPTTFHVYDSAGTIDKVYKGATGKTPDYASGYNTEKSLIVGTTDATLSAVLEFQWTAEAEL